MIRWTKHQGRPFPQHPGFRSTMYTTAVAPRWAIVKVLTEYGEGSYVLLHNGQQMLAPVGDITACKRRAERVIGLERVCRV